MAHIQCIKCSKKHEAFNWTFKKWRIDDEVEIEGWGCEKDLLPDREWTTDQIKQDRKKYAKDIVQPYRSGELSKEYVDVHGYKDLGISKEQASKAKKVWD